MRSRAADARVKLQCDVHRLPDVTESSGERGNIEAILRARKCRAESAVLALEHVDDAGKAGFREQRAVETALRRATGVHALYHCAKLRCHKAGGLRTSNAKRVHSFRCIELKPARGAGRRRKYAECCAGMPPLREVLRTHANTYARADLVTGHCRG